EFRSSARLQARLCATERTSLSAVTSHAGQRAPPCPSTGREPDPMAWFMLSARGRGKTMTATYRAIEVSKAGKFSEVQRPLVDPVWNQVRIRVEACGVCHSDAATVEGLFPIDWPRVPGHEVVGRIDALGPGVQGWAVGQRVGVGFLGGAC